MTYFDSLMKIYLEQIKANEKYHGKKLGFVDSGLVKTCDELVIGQISGGTHFKIKVEQST